MPPTGGESEAWEDAASSIDPRGSYQADVAEQLAALGPTHRAKLQALDCPSSAFTQGAALALLRRLVKVWKCTRCLESFGGVSGRHHGLCIKIPLPFCSEIPSGRFRLPARGSLNQETAQLSS